jgi:hypothetical protein
MLIVVLVAAEGHAQAVADTAVVRMDLAKVKGAIRLRGLAAPLKETIVFARAKTLKQALNSLFDKTDCELLLLTDDQIIKLFTTAVADPKYNKIPVGLLVLVMPGDEFRPIMTAVIDGPAATAATAIAVAPPPPNGPAPPLPPDGKGPQPDQTIAAAKERACKFEEFCVTDEGKGKLSLKCGDIKLQASTDGAKISMSHGPIDVGVKFSANTKSH